MHPKTFLVKMWLRQRTARHPFVRYMLHYPCSLFRYSTVAIYIYSCWFFLCRTLFLLHIFHTTAFPCGTFLCTNLFMLRFFRVSLFLCIALFHDALLHNAMFSFWVLLQLQSLHVAIYFCCTLFMFHYFQGYG